MAGSGANRPMFGLGARFCGLLRAGFAGRCHFDSARLLLAAGLLTLSPVIAHAATPDQCSVPDDLLHSAMRLEHVAEALAKGGKLTVTVVGTASSALAGPEGGKISYPSRLQAALAQRLPKLEVQVSTIAKSRRTATEMIPEIDKILAESKPTLLIWQTGTVDAVRGVEPDEFRATLEEGIDKVRESGADIVLMDTQYSPRTETMIAAAAYSDTMKWVAQQREIPLFDRFAIMKHWSETGAFDFSSPAKPVRTAEAVHECIGHLLADLIVNSAAPVPLSPPKETQ